MPPRTPGTEPDPAADLLGRWQAHYAGASTPSGEVTLPHPAPEEPPADLPEPPVEAVHRADLVDDARDDDAGDTDAGDTDEAADEVAVADETVDDDQTVAVDDVMVDEPARPLAAPVTSPRHAAPRPSPGRRRPPSPRGGDQIEAAREVIEALGIAPAAPEPALDPTPEPGPEAAEPTRRRTVQRPEVGPTTDVEFAPRLLLRRVLELLLLLLVPATAGAGYLAYDNPTTLRMGLAGTLLILTLVLYAVRVGATPAHLAIHSGQLEVVRGNTREVFDLTSRFTRMEVVGKPGRRGWKVLMGRFGRDPLIIDSSMVDPAAFTAALERVRTH